MSRFSRAATLLLACAGHASAQQTPAKPPLLVTAVNYSPAEESVEFTMINESGQTITAWNVAIRARRPDGSIAKSGGFGTDSYLSAAGVISRGNHINPHDSLTMRVKYPRMTD